MTARLLLERAGVVASAVVVGLILLTLTGVGIHAVAVTVLR